MPTTDELKQRLHATAQQEHGEFAMALLVSEVIDPQIEGERLRQSFIDLLAPIDQQESVDLRQLLAFFRQSGFASRRAEAADLSHSNLQWVIAQRQGLPIAVASLLIEAGRRYGLAAYGINFPGHFLVSLEQAGSGSNVPANANSAAIGWKINCAAATKSCSRPKPVSLVYAC